MELLPSVSTEGEPRFCRRRGRCLERAGSSKVKRSFEGRRERAETVTQSV